ncbi:MAG: flippase [Chitinophagales bacterium]|nr:MAG: flippase [Chitinophagales bacterium]
MVFGFGSVFFLLKLLSKDEFGIWALFLTVTSIIEVARNGLIQNALIKHLASAPEAEHGVITTASFVLNFLLTALTVVLLLLLSGWLSQLWNAPPLAGMLKIYCITTILLIGLSQLIFVQQANFDFRGNFWGNFVRQGSLFAYIVLGYFFKADVSLYDLAWFQVAGALLGGGTAFFFGRKYLRMTGHISWYWVAELFHYGKFVLGTNISSMLYKSIDKMMLGAMLSTASVAIYDLAIRITNLLEVPTASMAAIMFPQSARQAVTQGNAAVKRLYEKSVGIILALVLPAVGAIWIFAEPAILLVAGSDYLDTVPVLRLTLLYGVFFPFSRQFGTVLDSMGKPRTNFYFVAISAVLNIIFNYVFITRFGVMGAVYGALVTAVIRLALSQIVLYNILKVNFLNVFIYMKEFYIQGALFGMALLRKRLGSQAIIL